MSLPRVIAVIDVGSNSVRLLVARELSPSAFEVVDEARFDARLAEGQEDGLLSPEGMERGLRALRITSQVALSHGPSSVVVAGTEALRRAPNSAEFVEEACRQTGLTVNVLTAQAEAFASFLGAVNSTAMTDGYLLDIGGGSLELTQVEGRRFAGFQSVPLGAIYAVERYLKSDPPTAREVRTLRKAVRQLLTIEPTGGTIVGVGGAIRNLARISRIRRRYPLRRLHEYVMPAREVRRWASSLAARSVEQRRKVPGITPARADILHAPAIVVDEVLTQAGAVELHVTGQGLREGLVWQELRGEAAVLADVRSASIAGLASANGVNVLSTEPVVVAAATLFDATAPLHGFGDFERDLLLHAGRLAGIGMHVDYYNRDRHAEYLVHSGDLHGFSHREIVLLAALVRWAGSGTPDLTPYRDLTRGDDGRRAHVLASLLGTARAVRRRVPSPIFDLQATLNDDGLRLRLRASGPIDIEIYELERQQKRLESVLERPVTFVRGA